MKGIWARLLTVGLCVVVLGLACKKKEDETDPLELIRLFAIDTTAGTIRELDARNGAELNVFAAPGPQILGQRCGLAYDDVSGLLYFHDPGRAPEIWVIDPDDPDPSGTATTLNVPSTSPNGYVGLAHDGTWLMALDPVENRIDWLNPDPTSPSGGNVITYRIYPEDLEEGLDASVDRLLAAGRNAASEWVIFDLDDLGGIVGEYGTNIVGFQPAALGYARGVLFIADMGNLQILSVDMGTGAFIGNFPILGPTSVSGLAAGPR